MALYLAGDIQGCLDELKLLLAEVDFDTEKDQLWLVGDLVARGPKSLETLRFIKSLGKAANFVLGNHDLHLLSIHAGIKNAKKSDKLEALLAAEDRAELMDWLAQHPLLLELPNQQGFVCHAGISPQWTLEEAVKCAHFVEKRIAGKNRNKWLEIMYGNEPNQWPAVKTKEDKFRFTVNTLTRMRYVFTDGSLEFACKDKPKAAPKALTPWFNQVKLPKNVHIVFGHWAALMGNCAIKNIYALDTGCVWGNHMTLLRWHDKKLFIQKSLTPHKSY